MLIESLPDQRLNHSLAAHIEVPSGLIELFQHARRDVHVDALNRLNHAALSLEEAGNILALIGKTRDCTKAIDSSGVAGNGMLASAIRNVLIQYPNFIACAKQVGIPIGAKVSIILGSNMKTAISIDDGLLQEADETARLMGLSRSRLFAIAVGDFLERQRQERMLLRLNEVYANAAEQAEKDPAEKRLLNGIKAKVRRTVKDRW
jgi:predicted transcriptional regulator